MNVVKFITPSNGVYHELYGLKGMTNSELATSWLKIMTSLTKMSSRKFHHFKISFNFSETSFLILLVFQQFILGYSEPQFVSSFCIKESGSYTSNSQYQSNLSLLFFNLTSEASLRGFYNFTAGTGIDKVYGLFYCRGDLKLADFHACIETATSRIVYECPNQKEAIVFFEECSFRYANRSIFSREEEDPNDWSYSQAVVSNKDQFNDVLTAAISGPINQAAFNSSTGGFATGITTNSSSNQTVYCLAQCTPDILGTSCGKCLLAALGNLLDEGKTKMSLFMPSCQVMYSLAPFFNSGNNATNSSPVLPGIDSPPQSPSSQTSHQSPKKRKVHIGVGIAVALGLLFILFGLWFWMYWRRASKKDNEGQALKFQHNEHKAFTYEELSLATDNFSRVNLIGEGGFGYVHKGVLPNGKVIAVKKLKTGSAQGEREFQAEVETISRVHHRHLVSLVGHCISGDQRLLVYEFIPNKTLEFHLSGIPPLSWEKRLRIALGAAKGLAYLHEDCHPKIIHHDFKAANILIDNEFEAKVADFGLAKFSLDTHTHVTTRVVGTVGYLAPDYAASGKLTEKSDVFSFGVLLLEIITGRKPVDRLRPYTDGSMVEWARPLLRNALQGRSSSDLVDPKLEDYNPFEMTQMIACAAACINASARERPQMSQVVKALEGNLSADNLIKENIQHNRMFEGSSDVDSNAQHDFGKSGKVGFESEDQTTGESSALTSENASTSSTVT